MESFELMPARNVQPPATAQQRSWVQPLLKLHVGALNYPGHKPPKRGVKRAACPHKTAIETRFSAENAKHPLQTERSKPINWLELTYWSRKT